MAHEHDEATGEYRCEQCDEIFNSEREQREHQVKAHAQGKAKSAAAGQRGGTPHAGTAHGGGQHGREGGSKR